MSTFLPFSEASKRWEPIAEKLRRLCPSLRYGSVTFDPWTLAPEVGLRVVECSFFGLSNDERTYMQNLDGKHWSGGFVPTLLPDGTKLCMLNPHQPRRRQKITLMEEICHAYLEHSPTVLNGSGEGRYRDFKKKQEEEAFAIGAAVLLPWYLFFPKLNNGQTYDQLAELFDVTRQLVQYRVKVCGASSLYNSRQRRRLGELPIVLDKARL